MVHPTTGPGKNIGLIFNLDKRDEPGSHWIAIFINTHLKTIEYFDSLGNPPTRDIKKSLVYVQSRHKDYSLTINSRIHQRGNTACGIYSILFILFKLNNPNNYDYLNITLPDSKVHPFRQKFFRPVI